MDNTAIYENIMMTKSFNRLKTIRNSWTDDNSREYGLETIIDIEGHDYRSYSWIMKCCEDIVFEMLPEVIMSLLKAYGIDYQTYKVVRNDAYVFSVKEFEDWPEHLNQSNRKNMFLFSCKNADQDGVLYIFKKYGIGERLPKSLINTILKENDLKGYFYISITEKDAYSEVLNHNDNEEDPSRGTGLYSLKFFFDNFFGAEEYETFKGYAAKFTDMVKDYFGFEVVRTLKPNTLHNFRKTVRDSLLGFDIGKYDSEGKITESQRKIISNNYYGDSRYELLTGTCDFAESYMTAEWLFTSLEDAGNIDLTAIAMGYFKAIEQLLFRFIKLHTKEKDGKSRKVYVGKGKNYADSDGNAELTDKLVEDEDKSKDINLGSLTGFFGFYNDNKKCYFKRNQDLLADGIDEQTYEFIVDVLMGVVGLRNGYFHKHNLNDWDKVIEARNSSRLVFWLILGAYSLDDSDKERLGYIKGNEQDDYYKLCRYLNNKAYAGTGLNIPIYYMNGQTDPYGFWMGYQDDFIEYDKYGEPIYSGVYFRSFSEKERIIKATKDHNLPGEIWEGELCISTSIPIKMTPSGPKKKIYKDGQFFAE